MSAYSIPETMYIVFQEGESEPHSVHSDEKNARIVAHRLDESYVIAAYTCSREVERFEFKGRSVFTCRYCGRHVDFLKPYHSDTIGLWHWECGS